MPAPPRISVIIPTYNGDRYLSAALDSVLAQTSPAAEIIVVDDGSTDGTRACLEQYGDRLRCIYQENQGVAIARNRGVEAAQGDVIAFLDQDDLFRPHKLAQQGAALADAPAIGFVSSGWQILDAAGSLRSEIRPWQDASAHDPSTWLIWKPVFLGAMLFRKAALAAVGGFNPRFQQTSDVELVLRLVMAGWQWRWTQVPTVGYRQHDSNASRNVAQQAQELEQVLDHLFGQPNLSDTVRQLEAASRYQSYVWSAWRFYANGDLAGMQTSLEKSLGQTSRLTSEVVLDWVKQFKAYAGEYGDGFNAYQLSETSAWKQLIARVLLSPGFRSTSVHLNP
ncbi:MAG: glycosyltransferase family A protein [Synechococcales bacterium]|nr:glycosyltransferase family A protein [Synechococcales bacterium]